MPENLPEIVADSPLFSFDGGVVWDSANSLLALAAIAVSIYFSWKAIKIKDFEEEFSDAILSGCNEVKAFMSKISITLNIWTEQERKENAVSLMNELNEYTHPLLQALSYADSNLDKKNNDVWNQKAVEIIDDIAAILALLEGNTSNSHNWKPKYDALERSVYEKISEIHKKVKKARSKHSRIFNIFN